MLHKTENTPTNSYQQYRHILHLSIFVSVGWCCLSQIIKESCRVLPHVYGVLPVDFKIVACRCVEFKISLGRCVEFRYLGPCAYNKPFYCYY